MVAPNRSICRCVSSAFLVYAALFIFCSFLIADYRQSLFQWQTVRLIKTKTLNPICESGNRCAPEGAEGLPRGMIRKTSDFEMHHLWGPSMQKTLNSPISLLALAVGVKQKENVDKMVQKFPADEFVIMLFHYDGNVDGWKDIEWSNHAIHVSAVNQTKWWFAKRFLHPDVVAEYAYIFLWDEDLGVENFHAGRYISIVKEEGLEISQPGIDPENSEVHYKFSARDSSVRVHRRAINLGGPGRRCYEDSTEPPCTGFVEMMAPVFSRASWRCTWYMIQNDLIHAWGLDFQLGYCAQGNRTANIGIVDSEYIVHYGLPTLGASSENKTTSEAQTKDSQNSNLTFKESTGSGGRNAVRKRQYAELEIFKNRWKKAVREDKCWTDPFHQPIKQNA